MKKKHRKISVYYDNIKQLDLLRIQVSLQPSIEKLRQFHTKCTPAPTTQATNATPNSTAPLAGLRPPCVTVSNKGSPRSSRSYFANIDTSEPLSSILTNYPPFLRLGHHRWLRLRTTGVSFQQPCWRLRPPRGNWSGLHSARRGGQRPESSRTLCAGISRNRKYFGWLASSLRTEQCSDYPQAQYVWTRCPRKSCFPR